MSKDTRPAIVQVRWLDSWAEHGWRPVTEGASLEPDHCVTVGFLMHESDELMVIAQSISVDIPNGAGWVSIPKVSITERRTLKEAVP